VGATRESRSQILQLAEVFRARVLDIAADSITVELTGGEEKVDRLLELLHPFGLLEVVRTGIVAMRRGAKSPNVTSKAKAIGAVDDGTVSYSV
jgi:acetolactate synthase-1/3 small subunit